jgi:hypothetical protein
MKWTASSLVAAYVALTATTVVDVQLFYQRRVH